MGANRQTRPREAAAPRRGPLAGHAWPRYPAIYEINTWVWLEGLSQRYHRHVTLASVPAEAWDGIGAFGFDAVWLMGVWQRSPAGTAIANENAGLLADFRRALPDFQPEDNVGSPYCVRDYVVDAHLGGRDGLAVARRALASRGLALMLDFVPNHVAPDHPWVTTQPAYFVRGQVDDVRNDPVSFVQIGQEVFARGRDPYFPAWPDVLQLNVFQSGLREAVIDTLSDIASQCDGVRCDMAMLPMNDVFERTWGPRAGQRPVTEYWVDVIAAVRKAHPDFLFVAEAYWDLEWPLQQLGFDFCYDKRLYHRLEHDPPEAVRGHLCADLAYQGKLVRFIENHDEPRAAATFAPAKARAAAVAFATIPGATLFHEGQFEGHQVRLPVFLGRRPVEADDVELQAFYRALVPASTASARRSGDWQLCDCSGWPDNPSYRNLVAWCWRSADDRLLVVVNLSNSDVQALVRVPWDDLQGSRWRVTDLSTDRRSNVSATTCAARACTWALAPWGFHVLTGWSAA